MVFLYGALMFLALIGMMICSKKQKTNPAMQPIAFVLLIVVVVCGFFLMKDMGVFGGGTEGLMQTEMAFYASQGTKAGKTLAATNAGKKALLVVDPGFEKNETIQGLIKAFKEGFGGDVEVDTIALPAGQEDAPMPLFMMMKAKDFDGLLAKHPGVGVVVTTIGLPSDAPAMQLWRMPADKRPSVFMIGLPSGAMKGMDGMIQQGVISGVIISNPEAKYDVSAPSDPEEAFKIRYMLVDKNNVKDNAKYLAN